jgi:large subunit ribosomal protein L18
MSTYSKIGEGRYRRQARVRAKVVGEAARPRLSVFRSARHVYAQLIDDATGRTLATASTLDADFAAEIQAVEADIAAKMEAAKAAAGDGKGKKKDKAAPKAELPDTRTKVKQARAVGRLIARRAKGKDIGTVVFDRNGFLYHGRIKAVAGGAREAGLEF